MSVLEVFAGNMRSLEQLDVAHNGFTNVIPATVCQLSKLQNFTYSFNYFTGEQPSCAKISGAEVVNGSMNCIHGKMDQRSFRGCFSDAARPVDCSKFNVMVVEVLEAREVGWRWWKLFGAEKESNTSSAASSYFTEVV
ncbi:hypothetical protein F3Y22_tig00117048pilonHSYRG01323 [Hibiscus syriacus]|uniref:Uncharacterized protein n=1 Tax=Hibiscus syriacus TaxID=106335 RepID=A0A6A2XL83_HIBSY|nr:hypothetical protein F3Y22_tig00117048pilonHSYRG01323 [Hibiscus syriacus]